MVGTDHRTAGLLGTRRRPSPRRWSVVVLATVLAAGTGCAQGAADGVTPLPDASPTTALDGATTGTTLVEGDALGPDPVDEATVGHDSGTLAAEVTELLAAYDRALGDLYATPLAAADADHPLTVGWHEIVEPGSVLDDEVRTRILTDGRDNHLRVVAGAEGFAFRNLPLEVEDGVGAEMGWTNCGYSPGVGVHTVTGEVIDERRASTRGRGRAVRAPDGHLVLTELFDDRTELLGDGEPDPCPGLSGSARRAVGSPGEAER